MIVTAPPLRASRSEPLVLAALALLAVAMVAYFWVAYLGSDDQDYAIAALEWLHHFPALGKDNWALRYVPVLPIAAAFGLLGSSAFALALPNAVAFGALLLAHYAFLRLALRLAFGCDRMPRADRAAGLPGTGHLRQSRFAGSRGRCRLVLGLHASGPWTAQVVRSCSRSSPAGTGCTCRA
jgi:hypothetical protein